MHLEPAALGDLGDGADFGERVDGAEIARLRDVDRCGLAAMQLAWLYCRQGAGEGVWIYPAVRAGDRRQFQPAAEKPGGIGFRGVDVRRLAAIDEPPGRAPRPPRKGVGGRAGGDRKNAHLRLE